MLKSRLNGLRNKKVCPVITYGHQRSICGSIIKIEDDYIEVEKNKKRYIIPLESIKIIELPLRQEE